MDATHCHCMSTASRVIFLKNFHLMLFDMWSLSFPVGLLLPVTTLVLSLESKVKPLEKLLQKAGPGKLVFIFACLM